MSALSTGQAASLLGITPASFRRAMTRAREQGHDFRLPGPDARTPMWDGDALTAWQVARPGSGNWGKRG